MAPQNGFSESSVKRFNTGVTVLVCATVVVVAYAYERSRLRWWGENDPFEGPRDRARDAWATYRKHRGHASDAAEIIGVLGQAALAIRDELAAEVTDER